MTLWISYKDLLYGKIPNVALLFLGLLLPFHITLLNLPYNHSLMSGLLGLTLVLVSILFSRTLSFIGAGDLKLFGLACFFTDLRTFGLFMTCAGLLALCSALIYRRQFQKKKFPLGPALMIALYGTVIYQFILLSPI